MPRKPIDYSKTHFYKIVCRDKVKQGVEPETQTKRENQSGNTCIKQNKQARSFCALEPQHQQHITLTQVVVRERGISVSNYGYFTLT